jgi:hypothetical protein
MLGILLGFRSLRMLYMGLVLLRADLRLIHCMPLGVFHMMGIRLVVLVLCTVRIGLPVLAVVAGFSVVVSDRRCCMFLELGYRRIPGMVRFLRFRPRHCLDSGLRRCFPWGVLAVGESLHCCC